MYVLAARLSYSDKIEKYHLQFMELLKHGEDGRGQRGAIDPPALLLEGEGRKSTFLIKQIL